MDKKKNSMAPKKKEPAEGKKWKFKRLPRYARVLIIVFSVVVFIGAAGTGGFFLYLNSVNNTINSITTAEIENILDPIESPEEPVTILILGRDSRDTEGERGRTDTIMLLYLDPEKGIGSLLSIPRDTLVEIPGYGEDKINAAYAYGGEELTIRTIQEFIGADINHYVTLDFQGFVDLVDAMGGVDITIDRPLVDPKSGANLSPGDHHLTGEQALAYTRSRSTELGDIGRIQRQQHLFKELIDQKLNIQYLSNIPHYFNILIENTRTDLEVMTILRYSKAALSFNSESFETGIIPTHSDWIKDNTVSVQIPNIEEARAMWERIKTGEPMSRYNAEYTEVDSISDSMTEDTAYTFKIKVKNTGALTWNRNGGNPIYLGYHWVDYNTKEMVVFDGKRSIISDDGIDVGQEATFDLKVIAPPEPGDYILQIDLVHEGVTWFSYQGVPPMERFVSVGVGYAAQYDDGKNTPNYLDPGQEYEVEVKVKNTGLLYWENEGDKRIDLGTHWINRDTGEMVVWDGNRGLLEEDIDNEQGSIIKIIIRAPEEPGRYMLQYDMAHERTTWFSEQGVIPLEVNIDVGKTFDMSIVKVTSVLIYNGNGMFGSAGEARNALSGFGFKIYSLANAENYDFSDTVIIYNKDQKEAAEQLKIIFENARTYEYNSEWAHYKSKADLVLILGKDYKQYLE
ncbi:MAG: LCP family protein [Actinobacteria bacterium]|nr:LCP family protein [Actinomycetota bacterium]